MNHSNLRWGLTRMGVAVSVLCIGMFLVLLFPYLVQSRAHARRETCQLRLTQIGLALAHYGDAFQSLPYGTQQNPELPPRKRLSWYPQIWPFIANNTAELNVHYDEPWDSPDNLNVRAHIGQSEPPENATDAPLLVCPAMQFDRLADMPGPTSYVGIAGVGTDAAELEITDARAGIWGYERCTRLEILPPGVGSILLLAETSHETGPWTSGGPATVRGLDPDRPQLIGLSGPLGGNHPGGANVAMADYSTEFLTDNTDTRLLTQLATLRSVTEGKNVGKDTVEKERVEE